VIRVTREGDLHRADLAWALHAAGRGLSEQKIRDELLHARDLSKKGGPRGNLTTHKELRPRRSAPWSRSTDGAASLWTVRRQQLAARCVSACRSRSAARNGVRHRSTASAPALRAASLYHARRLRLRRIEIMRKPSGSGEGLAPQKLARCEEKQTAPWPVASVRGRRVSNGNVRDVQKQSSTDRKLDPLTPLGVFAFHWRCFGDYLHA
jgi:hypothetical protein